MARRLYLHSTAAPGISPAYAAAWEDTGGAVRRTMAVTKQDSALTTLSRAEAVSTNNYDVALAQYHSPPLVGSGTLSGTFHGVALCSEAHNNQNAYSQCVVRVLSSDGSTVRGTALDAVNTGGTEWPTSAAQRYLSLTATPALSSVAYSDGDVIVVEIGYSSRNTSTTSWAATIRVGDPVAGSDMADAESGTGDNVPWVEFSQDVVFVGDPVVTSMTADAGLFTHTGQDATLTYESGFTGLDTPMQADAGLFTLTGQDATLTDTPPVSYENYVWQDVWQNVWQDVWQTEPAVDYPITADAGTFTLTGIDATLSHFVAPIEHVLTAAAGVFALAGQVATTTHFVAPVNYSVTAEAGTFTHAGQDATLTHFIAPIHTSVTADAGLFALAGQDAATSHFIAPVHTSLTATFGAFTLTGIAATTGHDVAPTGTAITASYGAFTLAGQDATLSHFVAPINTAVVADAGLFTLSGQAATTTHGAAVHTTLTADAGLYTLAGQDATLSLVAGGTNTLTANAGLFTLTGGAAGLAHASTPAPGTGGDDIMAQWTQDGMLDRFKLYLGRGNGGTMEADELWTNARCLMILADAQETVYADLAPIVPDAFIGPPVLLTSADGGITYTFDATFPFGHVEIYAQESGGRTLHATSYDDSSGDFVIEGSLVRTPGNRARTYSSGPWARFARFPDRMDEPLVEPSLMPQQARELILWKALELAAEVAAGAMDSGVWEKRYLQARSRWITTWRTQHNRGRRSNTGPWWLTLAAENGAD